MSITLTGEQKRILTLPLVNPIQLKGVAGSGKTTVAIYRAKHLLANTDDLFRVTRVCIFSYSNSLIKYVRCIMGNDVNYQNRIQVATFHKWAYSFLWNKNFWLNHSVAKDNLICDIISACLTELRAIYPKRAILSKTPEFYKEEISWLKGRQTTSQEEYLEAKRVGRGTADRVTSQDKELLWKLYSDYCRKLKERNCVDFDDYALLVIEYLEKDTNFKPPFSHIVVDEAQDLTPAQLVVITKLVNSETNSLTIIADAAQRIYKSGFTWSGLGINIRGGRTVELKHNYRNTRQVADAAVSLLLHDPQQSDFSEHVLPERDGPKPKILFLPNGEQKKFLIKKLKEIDFTKQSAAILHRNRQGNTNLSFDLKSAGFNPLNIIEPQVREIHSVGLYTCTMPSVKGLEFDHVFLCDMNDDLIPYPQGFSDENDELHISTERRLVYTCMTRARETLHIIYTGQPSRYLSEIDPVTVERE
ncbi:MAG TPA: UvrD-helicase domain-containing protein [Clostridiales bacterium]|nr:UvrD-helicase domain-containing protein [Clostridiales bacterium]HQP70466.1 UvrD-helicase domain-containing protein [Clostridiales bacterium]